MMQQTQRPLHVLLVIGAPLLLALLECFHPHPDLLHMDLARWMLVHYLQLPLFPLVGLAIVTLVGARHDVASMICRVAAFVFAVSYVAFDTAAGIVTGILLTAAKTSGDVDSWRGAIDAVWTHPIMGGSPSSTPLLAILGSIALSIASVTAAISLKLGGHSWTPVILLAISGFGIAIFKTHAWPGGPMTFGGIAIAATLIELERGRIAKGSI